MKLLLMGTPLAVASTPRATAVQEAIDFIDGKERKWGKITYGERNTAIERKPKRCDWEVTLEEGSTGRAHLTQAGP